MNKIGSNGNCVRKAACFRGGHPSGQPCPNGYPDLSHRKPAPRRGHPLTMRTEQTCDTTQVPVNPSVECGSYFSIRVPGGLGSECRTLERSRSKQALVRVTVLERTRLVRVRD